MLGASTKCLEGREVLQSLTRSRYSSQQCLLVFLPA